MLKAVIASSSSSGCFVLRKLIVPADSAFVLSRKATVCSLEQPFASIAATNLIMLLSLELFEVRKDPLIPLMDCRLRIDEMKSFSLFSNTAIMIS